MKWVLVESNEGSVARLSDEAGIHPLIARLMLNRGISEPARARSFLSAELAGLSGPGIFAGMEKAICRIRKAISGHEKIVVYGDYDVDGVTGAALLYLVLKDLGAQAGYYIPDRITEGYGLNAPALRKIKASGAGLMITVDCGISAVQEAAQARSLGLDLIITDHHEFLKSNQDVSPPDAHAIIHPELVSPEVPERVRTEAGCLTGVGMAFKVAQALSGAHAADERLLQYLDLVTLGTIADMGRMIGENRTLVKRGLAVLSEPGPGQRPGIAALKQVSGLSGRKIGAGMVGFALAPRINASGRLESADAAFRLLTTRSREEAAELAGALDAVNRERQSVEERIWEEARAMCLRMDMAETGAIVLASPEWHPGVVGIVASRIAEEFYRPTALICVKEGVGKGSARSIPGFDLYRGLMECSGLLTGFGGHTYAAGLSVTEDRIPELRERLSAAVRERMGAGGFVRTLSVDGSVTLGELTPDLVQELERLAPFGQGNPEPRLGARKLVVMSPRVVGNNHLKFRLRQQDGTPFSAIAFNKGGLLENVVREGSRLAAVFTPRLNTWNGTVSVELDIRDVKREN